MLGPGVNIYVAPMNGRNFEYFGEDPFLAAHRRQLHRGMQKLGVSATVKHFMGNNSSTTPQVDAIIDERAMREIYCPSSKPPSNARTSAPSWIPTI